MAVISGMVSAMNFMSHEAFYVLTMNPGRDTQQHFIQCLVKVKKNTAKTVYEQSCSTSDPKRQGRS